MDTNQTFTKPFTKPFTSLDIALGRGFCARYDVVVVGARAAGASTAMLLARRGLSVLAIDRTAYGSDTRSTHSLAGAGVLQLSRWGLLDAVRAADTPVANSVLFQYGDEEVVIDVPVRGDVDGLYSPRRTVLDRILVDAAIAAGAHVRHGVSLTDVTTDADGRVDGVIVDMGGERRRIGAGLVVGADGANSRVAKLVGAEVLHQETVGAAIVYGRYHGMPRHTILNYYRHDRVAGVIPTNDDESVVWAGLRPDTLRASTSGPDAHAAIIESFDELEMLHGRRSIDGYRVFPGVPGFLRAAHGPGWALVGDSGYFKDPVSAHGITDALISAELLANAVRDVRGGAAEHVALDHYQEQRNAMALDMMPPVASVASFPGDMNVVKQGFRDMSRAMRNELEMIATTFDQPTGQLATV